MMVVPWVLLLLVIVLAAGTICWIKNRGTCNQGTLHLRTKEHAQSNYGFKTFSITEFFEPEWAGLVDCAFLQHA